MVIIFMYMDESDMKNCRGGYLQGEGGAISFADLLEGADRE
jgi:hypothetical protein